MENTEGVFDFRAALLALPRVPMTFEELDEAVRKIRLENMAVMSPEIQVEDLLRMAMIQGWVQEYPYGLWRVMPMRDKPHITRKWDKDWKPVCEPWCPACKDNPLPGAVKATQRVFKDPRFNAYLITRIVQFDVDEVAAIITQAILEDRRRMVKKLSLRGAKLGMDLNRCDFTWDEAVEELRKLETSHD